MSTPIKLIVGLGNPGADYEDTRHNAGAWFVSSLAHLAKTTLRHEKKYHGLFSAAHLFHHDCQLLIPTTFMNLSGQSVSAVANFYKISAEEILVAHDEIDLPAGETRLKFDGGHGGHNGLRDIIAHLNTNKFYRLRIGVGRPIRGREEVVDFVLKPPSKSDRKLIDESLDRATTVMSLVLDGDMQKAMHNLHSKI